MGILASNVYHENRVFLDLSIDFHVLAFTIGMKILTGLLFGLVPAWRSTQPRSRLRKAVRVRSRLQTVTIRVVLTVR